MGLLSDIMPGLAEGASDPSMAFDDPLIAAEIRKRILETLAGGRRGGAADVTSADIQNFAERPVTTRDVPSRPPAGVPYEPPRASPRPEPMEMAGTGGGTPPASASPSRGREPTFSERMVMFGNALQGHDVSGAMRSRETENITARALMTKLPGMSADEAMMVARNPSLLGALAPKLFETGKTWDLAKITDDNGYEQTVAVNRANPREFVRIGVTPTPSGTAAPSAPGGSAPSGSPSGASGAPAPSGTTAPLGTGAAPAPLPPGVRPGDYMKRRSTDLAAARVKAEQTLPEALRAGEMMLRNLDALESHPSLDKIVGPVDGLIPAPGSGGFGGAVGALTNIFSGGSEAGAHARLAEIQGGAFLQAFQTLKGGGSITEKEGEKATAALNRLQQRNQTETEYRAAIKEFKDEVRKLMDIARERAGVPRAERAPDAPAPSTSLSPASSSDLDKARFAISRGAPRDAVIRRLRDAGLDPSGL